MKCPRCGSEVGIGAARCPRCASTLGNAVATGALTPPPAGPPPDQDDATTFGVGRDDLTIAPPTTDVTIAPPPSTRAPELDATVLMPGRLPSTVVDAGMTLT